MKLAEHVSILERELRDLANKWERFFGGDLKVPPVIERARMDRRLRLLSERPGTDRRADQFRLENLQHKFMSYSTNWERMLRDREEGRGRAFRVPKGSVAPPPPKPNASPATAVQSSEGKSLFDRFQQAKVNLGQTIGLDREAFEAKMATQKKALEARLGSSVRFEVKVQDGKVKLAAHKIRSTE